MPIPLPTNLIEEKNKLLATVPHVELLEIQVSNPAQTLRYCNKNQDIPWNGQTWNKFRFEEGEFTESQSGEMSSIEIRVSNINRTVEKLVLSTPHLLIGDTVVYRLIHPDYPNEQAYLTQIFETKNIDFDITWATFNLGAKNFYLNRFPAHKYSRLICRYEKFKDPNTCGYTGPIQTCDRTLATCLLLGNVARIGAQPAIPNGAFDVYREGGDFYDCYDGRLISVKWGESANPEIFTGNVITVGNDGLCSYDYDNPRLASDAASSGDMLLIYPGLYDIGTGFTWQVGNKDLIIKGMGVNPDDVQIVNGANDWHGINISGSISKFMIEGVHIQSDRQYAGALVLRECLSSTEVYVNKTRLLVENTGGFGVYFWDTIANSTFLGDCYMTNCYISAWDYTYRGVGQGGGVVSAKRAEYNFPYDCDNCTQVPNPHDYVTSPTSEYGENYGNNFVEFL